VARVAAHQERDPQALSRSRLHGRRHLRGRRRRAVLFRQVGARREPRRARANVVLDNLVDAGFMSEGQVFGARRNPATPIDRRDTGAPNYYLDYAFDEMRKLVDAFPKSVTDRYFGVRTALDSSLQHYA